MLIDFSEIPGAFFEKSEFLTLKIVSISEIFLQQTYWGFLIHKKQYFDANVLEMSSSSFGQIIKSFVFDISHPSLFYNKKGIWIDTVYKGRKLDLCP